MSATVRNVMTTRVVAVRRDASFKEMAAMRPPGRGDPPGGDPAGAA
ncbi:MAG TPA: hypothetical protein VMU94_17220 [Streptosporangiaceae bacterium]|nr:hypothetical protein [Streptosporangiaceae bacterium]